VYPKPINHFNVDFTFDKCNRLIGEIISVSTLKEILTNLEIEILDETETGFSLAVPPYRADVTREVDVIEEILRIYGYNRIAMSGRINASLSINPKPDAHKIQERVSELLSSNGFHEAMCNSLTKSSYSDGFESLKKEAQVELLNPLSQDLNALRQTLMFGGLESLAYNINRKTSDVLLYEFGKTYNKFGENHIEERHLALWATGRKQESNWNSSKDKVDFFYLKGMVEKLLKRLGLHKGISLNPIQNDFFSEGLAYKIRKKKVLEIGHVRPDLLKSFGIKQEVHYADLNWDAILELLKDQKTTYKEVSKFPEVRRDLALLLDKEILFSELESISLRSDKNILKEVSLFDVYQGEKLPEGKKSYALSFLFRDEEKTLTDKVVDKAILKIFKSLEHQLKAELRDGTL
jgi:phenylalanyl-tRNA synthetase beta chain